MPEVRRSAVVAHADQVVHGGGRVHGAERVPREVQALQREFHEIRDLAAVPRERAPPVEICVVGKALEQKHEDGRQDRDALIEIFLASVVAKRAHLRGVHHRAEVQTVLQADRAVPRE